MINLTLGELYEEDRRFVLESTLDLSDVSIGDIFRFYKYFDGLNYPYTFTSFNSLIHREIGFNEEELPLYFGFKLKKESPEEAILNKIKKIHDRQYKMGILTKGEGKSQ